MGKGTLSDGRRPFALQGRLINFEKRRKVSRCSPYMLAGVWKSETRPGRTLGRIQLPVIFVGRVGYTEELGPLPLEGGRRRPESGMASWEGLSGPSSKNRVGLGRSRE